MDRSTALFLCVSVAALCLAQAGPCPPTVCNSYFANAMGGPIDCCNFKYSGPGSKCSWAGTPVSFKYLGTCESGGKTYQALESSNQQGPSVSPDCRCKDPIPSSINAPAVAGYILSNNADIAGRDLPCDGNSFCKVCGSAQAVADRCKAGHKAGLCLGFTWDGSCGYLKSATSPISSRTGFATYTQAPPQQVSGFTAVANKDLVGNDIACGGKSFCQVCGGAVQVGDTCLRNSRCLSFTYDGVCGYLKSAPTGAVTTQKWTHYVRQSTATAGH